MRGPSEGFFLFETFYFDERGPHLLRKHYERMRRSAVSLGIPFEISFEEFDSFVKNSLKQVKRAFGAFRVELRDGNLFFRERDVSYSSSLFEKGLELAVSEARKWSKDPMNYHKTSRIFSHLEEEEKAKGKGFDSCLFLNENGFVCETAFANIFFRKGRTVFTPTVSCGLLPGLMREGVMEVLERLGWEVVEACLRLEDLMGMEECFVTNCVMGPFPVLRIEDVVFKDRSLVWTLVKLEGFRRPWNN